MMILQITIDTSDDTHDKTQYSIFTPAYYTNTSKMECFVSEFNITGNTTVTLTYNDFFYSNNSLTFNIP